MTSLPSFFPIYFQYIDVSQRFLYPLLCRGSRSKWDCEQAMGPNVSRHEMPRRLITPSYLSHHCGLSPIHYRSYPRSRTRISRSLAKSSYLRATSYSSRFHSFFFLSSVMWSLQRQACGDVDAYRWSVKARHRC